jgi:hypothetical protein
MVVGRPDQAYSSAAVRVRAGYEQSEPLLGGGLAAGLVGTSWVREGPVTATT